MTDEEGNDAATRGRGGAEIENLSPRLSFIRKIKRALRGEVDARTLAVEAVRRSRASRERSRERASLEKLAQAPARLRPEFASLSPSELLNHFRNRAAPRFLPGFASISQTAGLQRHLFPSETARLIETSARIVDEHCWPLLGYGERCFGEKIEWLRDPLSNQLWPLDYHADVKLFRGDGSDARVLWELNRLPQLVPLARAFAVTDEERFAEEIFAQAASWREQNPLGRGPNWGCAMELALRALNLLAVFEILRRSTHLNEERITAFLQMFDQHGAHIRRNLEFSYLSTSNHYLSDVVGLFWLGLMLPELKDAGEWREMGLREILREMDKQVLADGADFEASTGYHRLVLELFLYTFILARANGVEIPERYWKKLRRMLNYARAYLRPDGRAPLVGDTDSGQALPLRKRAGDDHAYVLALGAVIFDEPGFKQAAKEMPEELLWVLGEEGVKRYESLPEAQGAVGSEAYPDAGTYILRDNDLYLLFNASGNGLMGRGSHGHNDALSLEVSSCGTSFIIDPGTYVYSADLEARQQFRLTSYHSTVTVDGAEQNTTDPKLPFVIGNEAQPHVLKYEINGDNQIVAAEHYGYRRLAQPVTHRREVRFAKPERLWIIEDSLSGEGEHLFGFRFHFADGLEITSRSSDGAVLAWDKLTGARLFLLALEGNDPPELEPRFASRDYGAKRASVSACWKVRAATPLVRRWALVPVCAGDDEEQRLNLVRAEGALRKQQ